MASESKKLVVTVVVYGSDNNPIRSVAVEETGPNVELNLHTEQHLATAVIDGLHDIDPDTVEIADAKAPDFSVEIQSASKRDLLQGEWDAFCHRPRRYTLRKTKKNKISNIDAYNTGYNFSKELQYLGGDYVYCILPGGNADEFPLIDKALRKREIAYSYYEMKGDGQDGRVYRIHHSQSEKLPKEDYRELIAIPHLPVDSGGGHSLYHIRQDFAEEQRVEMFQGSDWIHVEA